MKLVSSQLTKWQGWNHGKMHKQNTCKYWGL
jgi:hypothetical protein